MWGKSKSQRRTYFHVAGQEASVLMGLWVEITSLENERHFAASGNDWFG